MAQGCWASYTITFLAHLLPGRYRWAHLHLLPFVPNTLILGGGRSQGEWGTEQTQRTTWGGGLAGHTVPSLCSMSMAFLAVYTVETLVLFWYKCTAGTCVLHKARPLFPQTPNSLKWTSVQSLLTNVHKTSRIVLSCPQVFSVVASFYLKRGRIEVVKMVWKGCSTYTYYCRKGLQYMYRVRKSRYITMSIFFPRHRQLPTRQRRLLHPNSQPPGRQRLQYQRLQYQRLQYWRTRRRLRPPDNRRLPPAIRSYLNGVLIVKQV